MEFKEYSKPSPYIIVDDFLTPEEYGKVRKEINDLIPKMSSGKMYDHDIGKETVNERKNNLSVWLDNIYPDRDMSNILIGLKNIWGNEMTNYLQNTDSGIFRLYNITNNDSTLLSLYKNGAFYEKHVDNHHDDNDDNNRLFLTSNLMIGSNFKGGDFMLGDKIIPFKDNRLLIFESHKEHQVTTVETDDDNWRYSIQYFAYFKG
jgi:Rps23 Pro-64 3,4-dihydroxylase Tpa1-like proline 4-hydroxylase